MGKRTRLKAKIAEMKARRDKIHQEMAGQGAEPARINRRIASLHKARTALRKMLDELNAAA